MNRLVYTALAIFSVISAAWSAGEMTVLHSPSGVQFSASAAVKANELSNVILAALGYSVESGKAWQSLSITNPFGFAKTAAVVVVDGALNLKLDGKFVPLKLNTELDIVRDALATRLEERENSLATFEGQFATRQPQLKLESLDVSREVDAAFLRDISTLSEASEQKGNLWLRLRGLHGLVDVYGLESAEVSEALRLLNDSLKALEGAMDAAYGDEFLLLAVASDESHTRRTRQILETRENNTFANLNVSKRYSQDYASIFNIILWISVFLIAALISTSVFICTMDPGRDSLIYRMTTPRMKKDN